MRAISGTTSSKRIGPSITKDLRKVLENSLRDDLILTPHLNNFLATWDGTIDPKVAEIIARAMAEKQRDRRGSWSASQAGKCLRRQELMFLGAPGVGSTSAQGNQILNNGRWVHLRWQATLLTAGLLDDIEVTHKKKSQRARCTLDGLGVAKSGRYSGRDFGFELKGRNEWVYQMQLGKGPDEQTRKQVDFEFLLTGLEIFVILNENKNNQAWHEWVIIRDDSRVREMASQIKELNRAVENQRLHPPLEECRKQLKSGEFYKCPYGTPGGACANAGSWPTGI